MGKLEIGWVDGSDGRDPFVLPEDADTQTFAILAKRGVGKTYTGMVLTEELLAAKRRVVVVDPLGVCWGLRVGDAGLPIHVFGGSHGDLPLEADAGELLARLVVEERISAVLDMSELRKGEQQRFVTRFAETLYRLNREPVHVVLDEADAFAPQSGAGGPKGDTAVMLGAIEDLVRRGRARGIGVTMITQRAAVLNKDVLTQIETLVVLRTTSPQDRKAMDAWISAHDETGNRETFLASLPSLPIGTAWVWSPAWLGCFERVRIRLRKTFDSSATPKHGATPAAEPATLAPVDIERIRSQMADVVERAEQDDPKRLRSTIAELRAALERGNGHADELASLRLRLSGAEAKVAALRGLLTQTAQNLAAAAMADGAEEADAAKLWSQMADDVQAGRVIHKPADLDGEYGDRLRALWPPGSKKADGAADRGIVSRDYAFSDQRYPKSDLAPKARAAAVELARSLGKCERSVLAVLMQHPEGCDRHKLTLLAGYRFSGSFKNALTKLRTNGLIVGGNEETMRATTAGVACAERVGAEPLPEGAALREYWLARFGKCERAILEALFTRRRGMTADELTAATGYEFSGSFKNALSRLRTAGLITGRNSETMRVSEHL